MNGLPYYRWYPADAETDEFYSSLSDAELGFFHRCLNKAWINNGLPADLNTLCAVMGRTRKELEKMWSKISSGWFERDGRLFNRRQEEERAHAAKKSERATDAVRTRYGRSTDELPRAQARADSDSDSDSVSAFKEKTTLREIPKTQGVAVLAWPPGFDLGLWLEERDRKHPIPGKPQLAIQYAHERVFRQFTPQEFDAAHDAWCEYWKGQDGGIPTLAVFIHEAWWRKLPPIRKPAAKDSWAGVAEKVKENIQRNGKIW